MKYTASLNQCIQEKAQMHLFTTNERLHSSLLSMCDHTTTNKQDKIKNVLLNRIELQSSR